MNFMRDYLENGDGLEIVPLSTSRTFACGLSYDISTFYILHYKGNGQVIYIFTVKISKMANDRRHRANIITAIKYEMV